MNDEPLLCPTEAQVRAMLETARTPAMSNVERVICEDAFVFVCDAVQAGKITWAEVMGDPHYAVAQVFDDYFANMGLNKNGCLDDECEAP